VQASAYAHVYITASLRSFDARKAIFLLVAGLRPSVPRAS
jgi:hypothetical protein